MPIGDALDGEREAQMEVDYHVDITMRGHTKSMDLKENHVIICR